MGEEGRESISDGDEGPELEEERGCEGWGEWDDEGIM